MPMPATKRAEGHLRLRFAPHFRPAKCGNDLPHGTRTRKKLSLSIRNSLFPDYSFSILMERTISIIDLASFERPESSVAVVILIPPIPTTTSYRSSFNF